MKNVTCCFTGHRPNKLYGYDLSNPKYQELAKVIKWYCKFLYVEHGVRRFITGGALGFDTLAFFAVNSLKSTYPDIQNVLAIPFVGQENAWKSPIDVDRYNRMKSLADEIIITSKIDEYSANSIGGKLNKRNHYMVDNSNYIVGLWDGTSGGTANCVNYANSQNINVIVLKP